MAGNRALFFAISGIILMAMIVPLILNPLPPVDNSGKAVIKKGLVGSAAFNPNTYTENCIEHANIDVFSKSYITYNGVNYVDYCSGSNVVKMICSSGKNGNLEKSSVSYPCVHGCANGACKLQ